ncbi:MAG: TetR/AcrR family transcriptional regulator [Acidobacteria bacterium]|nr:TetR/AcrR family transcriptional regulator [Acidobacteriota bacterium]
MGRRKVTPDADVLTATFSVISRVGPARLTLADVAAEAGLAPATLLQRFGSKRGLLLAVAEQGMAGVDECFARLRSAHPSPLAALCASLEEMTHMCETPEAMANSLAFLEIDLTDPDFHRLALENSRSTLAGYRALLDEAVTAGELGPCDTARLARALGAMCSGSMLSWAILREGTVTQWLRDDIETLLGPYRAHSRKARRGGRTVRRAGVRKRKRRN